MSQQDNVSENIRLIQQAYAAFKRGDVQTILDSLSNDVEWIGLPLAPVAGTYRGPKEVAQFFQKIDETSEYASFEPREYVAQGDRVIVLGSYDAKVKSTGRSYQCEWVMAFTVRDGKISSFQEFSDTAAIAAALPEAAAAGA